MGKAASLALALALSPIGGCRIDDPIVGSWESEYTADNGARDTFVIDDDLTGSGIWTFGGQPTCGVDIRIDDAFEAHYEGTIYGRDACTGLSANVVCDLVDEGDRLDCVSGFDFRRTE